jgi:glycosyltransferase involved in cell wall biosynthesis
MSGIALNLCALGDPRNPRTWSGTPFHIYTELVGRDRCGDTFDVEKHPLRRVVATLSARLYGTRDLYRTPPLRYARAVEATRRTARAVSKHTLHTGTLSLPFPWPPRGQRHYLFCDSTWDLWSRHSTEMDGYPARLRASAEALERRAYDQMAHIFPTARYVKQNLIEHYGVPPSKITPVGTGLGVIQPFHGEKDYSSGRILFAAKGRFADKGGELVLAAFALARRVNPRLELTIVGQNDYASVSADGVTALGHLTIEDLQQVFNTHALFVMPALNEPWGLVYLEAMACKMPIVGLDRNSFPELSGGGERGIALDTATPRELAQTLVDAFADLARLRAMGERAYRYATQTFSWAGTVDTILRTIDANE